MWEPLKRYKALGPEARKMFRRAAVLLPLVRVSLGLRGFKATQRWLQRKLAERPAPETEKGATRLEETCRMVRAAVRYAPVKMTCLEESLTLWYLLRSQGIAANLRIGVRKEEAEVFEAHAWVEHQGAALNQSAQQHRHYSPFEDEISNASGERS